MFVLAAACGEGDDPGESASETTTSTSPDPRTQDPGASGSGGPLGRGGGGATGAPLKLPAIAARGDLDADLLERIRGEIREACGGTVCVTLRPVDQRGRSLTAPRRDCDFGGGTDPRAGREVRRGSVVRLLFTCDAGETPSDTSQRPTTTSGEEP